MVLVTVIVLIVSILTSLFHDYEKAEKLKEYGIMAFLIVVFFVYNSRKADDVHIHHYTIAMIVLAFTGYQNAFATVVSGFFNGMMIEGGSFYGWDPVFLHYKHKPKPYVPHKYQKSLSLSEIKKLEEKS